MLSAKRVIALIVEAGELVSSNYVAGAVPPFYSVSGTRFDLTTGDLFTPGLVVDGVTGDVHVRGDITATSFTIPIGPGDDLAFVPSFTIPDGSGTAAAGLVRGDRSIGWSNDDPDRMVIVADDAAGTALISVWAAAVYQQILGIAFDAGGNSGQVEITPTNAQLRSTDAGLFMALINLSMLAGSGFVNVVADGPAGQIQLNAASVQINSEDTKGTSAWSAIAINLPANWTVVRTPQWRTNGNRIELRGALQRAGGGAFAVTSTLFALGGGNPPNPGASYSLSGIAGIVASVPDAQAFNWFVDAGAGTFRSTSTTYALAVGDTLTLDALWWPT